MPAITVNVLSVSCGETTKKMPTPSVATPNSMSSHHRLVSGRNSSAAYVDTVPTSGKENDRRSTFTTRSPSNPAQ